MNDKKAKYQLRSILQKNMSLTALVLALILGGVIMAICGYNPLEAYGAIFEGAFGGKKSDLSNFCSGNAVNFCRSCVYNCEKSKFN